MLPPRLSSEELLESLNSGALLLAPKQDTVIYANPRFLQMTGKDDADATGRALGDLIQWDGQEITAGTLPVDGGGNLRVKLKTSRLRDGHRLVLVDPFSEDMALTEAHHDFVSTVSHEFRTPLTSIKGFADTMLKYGDNLPADQQKRFINIIRDQADRLIRLVENLLTVSRLGTFRSQLHPRPVPLDKIIDTVVESIRMKHGSNARIRVDVAGSLPPVWADSDALEQVLLNLVDNAVKYSERAGGEVAVSAGLKPAPRPGEEQWAQIRVHDEGMGIAPEHLENQKLFTKFYRVESPLTQQVEGTGLGLYIVKSLTTALGGQIAVDSELGKGSTFTLTLPVATEEGQAVYQKRRTAGPDGIRNE